MTVGDDEGADLRLGLRPHTPAGTKPLNEPAVLHGAEPEAKLSHAADGQEPINFGQERRVHTGDITRYSVRVKPHEKTCVPLSVRLLLGSMDNAEWEGRLRLAIKDRWTGQGRSLRELGMRAGLGQNYVSQMLNDGKAPGAKAVVSIAQVLEVSLTWIYLGVEMSAEDEELLQLAARLDPTQKKRLLDLLNSIAAEHPAPSEP